MARTPDGRRDTKLGTTPRGKVIWLEKHPLEYKGWSPSDHLYAAVIHGANRTRGGQIAEAHRALAGKRAVTADRSHSTIKKSLATRLPVRDDVTEVQYHRPPTASESRFGHGATHYRTFPVEECCFPGTRVLKKHFVASDDGLRYYR